ncbi:glycosyltransferase family 4 protein [Vibrio mediterranei]|uniref:Glycosyltransferase subfamily 4-like N-terminal domain-containing protein n=1 Tax=Vibrio mediterranei TaxID=689 RepID=A0ABX5DFE2_9VIBR|nr:glycosyltransferase family 4 protein [Vibrio mediterranei]PCD87712.1 hypothetical protein COR52_15055 [Vibrio mediterranei]PRQ67336.1 hypothetical protein COR51_12240 [Vibrio mediterranei]
MKTIVHICTYSHFTIGLSYQENLLADQNVRDGYNVVIISDTTHYVDGRVESTESGVFKLSDRLTLIRLERKKLRFFDFLTRKVKYFSKLDKILTDIRPDIVMHHGIVGLNMLQLPRLKKELNFKLLFDSHADAYNTGRNFFVYLLLYRTLYRLSFKCIYKYVDSLFYISEDCKDFLLRVYGVGEEKLKYFPLGGSVVSENYRREQREIFRRKYNFDASDIIIAHSGKLDEGKNTSWLLDAFDREHLTNCQLVIAGSVPTSNSTLETRIKNTQNVTYLGWMDKNDLRSLLCASDIYAQPGTQSATMQLALCCGAPVLLYPYESHFKFVQGNGFYVDSSESTFEAIKKIVSSPSQLESLSHQSFKIANDMLDYKSIAQRMYF